MQKLEQPNQHKETMFTENKEPQQIHQTLFGAEEGYQFADPAQFIGKRVALLAYPDLNRTSAIERVVGTLERVDVRYIETGAKITLRMQEHRSSWYEWHHRTSEIQPKPYVVIKEAPSNKPAETDKP